MVTYTDDELTHKIQTFLAKKSQKFPELVTVNDMHIHKRGATDDAHSKIFEKLEALNSFWAQKVHSA